MADQEEQKGEIMAADSWTSSTSISLLLIWFSLFLVHFEPRAICQDNSSHHFNAPRSRHNTLGLLCPFTVQKKLVFFYLLQYIHFFTPLIHLLQFSISCSCKKCWKMLTDIWLFYHATRETMRVVSVPCTDISITLVRLKGLLQFFISCSRKK